MTKSARLAQRKSSTENMLNVLDVQSGLFCGIFEIDRQVTQSIVMVASNTGFDVLIWLKINVIFTFRPVSLTFWEVEART